MEFVCEASDETAWFRLVSEADAAQESVLMNHGVVNRFRREKKHAVKAYRAKSSALADGTIDMDLHIRRTMPCFLSLRDRIGRGLATAMLPPGGRRFPGFPKIIVGRDNTDPYVLYKEAIDALATHFGYPLTRDACFPIARQRRDLRLGSGESDPAAMDKNGTATTLEKPP